MLYDMIFYNWEYPLQNMAFQILAKKIGTTDFHVIKKLVLMLILLKIDVKFIYSIGQVNNTFIFFQIRSA